MFNLKKTVSGLAIAAAMAGVIAAGSARADNIVNEWASVKPPPAPALKPVAVETKTTALLMLDFMNSNCGARPRCVRSVPVVKTLLSAARAAGVPVIYSIVANTTTADIIKDLAPVAGEPWVQASVDKFVRTDLEKILQERGVRTVIVVGTAAHGAVFYTGSAAAMRGLNVVVPVDGVSADPYLEQATVWLLANGTGGIGPRVTLTQIDQIKF